MSTIQRSKALLNAGELPEHGKQKFIRVRCGTGREFVMRTSNKFNTVLEAQAAMRGKSLADFKIPAMRT